MLEMHYEGLKTIYKVSFSVVNENVIQLLGNFAIKDRGIRLSREGKEDEWDYTDYKTVYKKVNGGCQFSNNETVWIEPEAEEEPIPYEPTPEEIAEQERQEKIAELFEQISVLKVKIEETDYQIIKTYEYSLVGKESEYDIEALHAERQKLRNDINVLEAELSEQERRWSECQ